MLDLFSTTWEDLWAGHEGREPVGAVFTRPEIVDLILDVAGYAPGTERLAGKRVLEPSCGDGAFVSRVIDRLLASEREHGSVLGWDDPCLDHALRAADISEASLEAARRAAVAQLRGAGCPPARAAELAAAWFVRTDFLLHEWDREFDLVVGNPPYVRIEELPKQVLAEYRASFTTLGDRADLYVAFIERGLKLLSPGGVLAFITANRFAKNLYGRGIRRLIARRYRVRLYLNLEHTQPFLSDVSAYPAIVVVDRERGLPTRSATLSSLDPAALEAVRAQALSGTRPTAPVSEFAEWYPDGEPWLTTSSLEHGALRAARESMATLEDSGSGTRVGIGVATGADRVFILKAAAPEIETDRQLPLVLGRDVANACIAWSGHYVIDPFDPVSRGKLVDLRDYPGLARYLGDHEGVLAARHVARQRPDAWYRTIDRIWPELMKKPKLLIPDIQPANSATVGFDPGNFYPHHNLYWITSETWDLRALKALLRSSRVMTQVRAYSVQMRGGSLRWQAQTLRRIRLPRLTGLSDNVLDSLIRVSDSCNQQEIDDTAAEAFCSPKSE
jgi:hypothetical protein